MAETTIEWAEYTFNPWIGCEKVSAGCKHCYAERDASNRVSAARGLPLWGPGSTRRRTSDANWRKLMAWNRKAAAAREDMFDHHGRPRVFCASLADVFEARAELNQWRADLWALIEECDELDWLLLTKRPENVRGMVPGTWLPFETFGVKREWPRHVWIGTTVENQVMADERIPHLLRAPAAVRFLSVEPLLGAVDLREDSHGWLRGGIDWVIVGGESGPKARPFHPDWARSVRDQCQAAGVPFLFKQWGEWHPTVAWSEERGWHYEERAVQIGKKAAGRILDGRTWDEVPRGS